MLRKRPTSRWFGGFAVAIVLGQPAPGRAADEGPPVSLVRVPDGGIQPQAVADDAGAVHLIYFKGEPAAGDLYYARLEPGAAGFSAPVRVNSRPGSAVATGTIRGGQLALGRDGRVHVAWNGSARALPPGDAGGSPMLYARSDAGRTAFEPERDLMRRTIHLDGGGSIAADREGRVYVAWHAAGVGGPAGEAGRRLWVARSQDDGATFDEEIPASPEGMGACACCGTKALADRRGTLHVLFRAAREGRDRDMMLVTSDDHGASFRATALQPWPVTTCPMSSASLAESATGVVAAWETRGQVAFARIDPVSLVPSPPKSPPGSGGRKHPSAAPGANGELLLAWADGTGWQRGGALAWRLFRHDGRPARDSGRVEGGIPVWGLPAAVALPGGAFVIVH